MNIPPHPANIDGLTASVLSGVPPPYQPVSVQHLESQSSSEEPQDYLWLVNCESKKPVPNRWDWTYAQDVCKELWAFNELLLCWVVPLWQYFLSVQLPDISSYVYISTVLLLLSLFLLYDVCSSVECQPPLEENQEYLLLEECESKTQQTSLWVLGHPAGTACVCEDAYMNAEQHRCRFIWPQIYTWWILMLGLKCFASECGMTWSN